MAEYVFRPYEPGDEHAILATFNLVFAENNPAFTPRPMADWEWSYTKNPGGIRVWVAMQGDCCAAHYASQPNRTWIDGELRIFGQIIDSFVHPAHRRGLKRPGLFVETAQRMLAATCGPDKDLVTYGWPVAEAWRMGRTFLRYEMVRQQLVLAREVGDGSTALPAGVAEVERFDPHVDALYRDCARGWGASIVRDAAWLAWRFLENPRHRYRILEARAADGSLAGQVVLRAADWPLPGSMLVVDWLVPDPQAETGRALVEAACASARAQAARQCLAVLPEWSPWFERFQDWGFTAHPSGYLMSGRNNEPVHHMGWLRDHWWYQLAEMDLV
jgi:hypothetical protein